MTQLELDLAPKRVYYKRDKPLKVLELFGGIGAPRKALENINIEVKSIDYVEIISNAVKAYNAMYDHRYKPQNVLDWNINVDLLVHGSPCVDFSAAGRNDITSGRSILYERTIEIIKTLLNPKPKYVLWENVEGLLSKKHIKHFKHYLKSMESLGYRNYWRVLETTQFGLPQYRRRVFVVSIRNDLKQVFDFDALDQKQMPNIADFLEDTKDPKYDLKQPSMIIALENNKVKITGSYTGTITTRQVRWNTSVMFKDLSFYQRDLTNYPKPKSKYGYSLYEAKEYFPEMFKGKRLDQVLRYRTPKECWLLQGFDEKTFERVKNTNISETDLYLLAGNSIPVTVLEAIFKELLLKSEVINEKDT